MPAIGLYGGTFDPVHRGHLALAECALERYALDELIFIPSASPPHKPGRKITSFHHRFEMLRLALVEYQRNFTISDIESHIPSPSYTIDTLSYLINEKSGKKQYYFIIGSDAFLEVHTWKKYNEVLKRIHFIVVQRSGMSVQSTINYIETLGYEKYHNRWYSVQTKKMIYFLNAQLPDISSSLIRDSFATPGFNKDLLTKLVYSYIVVNNLYGV